MKRNTVDLIKDMNNPNQYIESFGLPFKYNPSGNKKYFSSNMCIFNNVFGW